AAPGLVTSALPLGLVGRRRDKHHCSTTRCWHAPANYLYGFDAPVACSIPAKTSPESVLN
ncbi:MAG TPA: hypothetical protein PLG60_09605, partial [Acidimicrobiales bacterium]|nr:hypothetical protein [Acidimicrobiales bacterium]